MLDGRCGGAAGTALSSDGTVQSNSCVRNRLAMTEAKVLRKDDMITLNQWLYEKYGFNRNIVPEALQEMSQDGYAVLQILMVHEHKYGVPVDPHYRLQVQWAKEEGEQARALLDCPMDVFHALPDDPDYQPSISLG